MREWALAVAGGTRATDVASERIECIYLAWLSRSSDEANGENRRR